MDEIHGKLFYTVLETLIIIISDPKGNGALYKC